MKIDEISDLATIAMIPFWEADGNKLIADTPNGGYKIVIDGNRVSFVPYGSDDDSDTEVFELVRV